MNYYDDYDDEFEDIESMDFSARQVTQKTSKRQSRQQSSKNQKTVTFSNPDNKSAVKQSHQDKSQTREISVSREKQNILNQQINEQLQQQNDDRPCQIAVFGAVDSGKSTIFGNLYSCLYDKDQNREKPYSTIFDNTQYEQQSGKTTQVCNYQIEIEGKQFLLQDCPGHSNLYEIIARNQLYYDACILVIDGVNYKRQINQIQDLVCLITIQKVKHILVLINKMDKLQFQRQLYQQACDKISKIFKQLNSGVINMKLQFIPVVGNSQNQNISNIIKVSQEMGYADMCLKDALLQLNKKINRQQLKVYQEKTLCLQLMDNEIQGAENQCLFIVNSGLVQQNQIIYESQTKLMYQIKEIQNINNQEVQYAVEKQLDRFILINYKKNIENNNGLKNSTELQDFNRNEIFYSVKDILNHKKINLQQANRLKVQFYTNDNFEISDILSIYVANTYVEGKILNIEAIYQHKNGFLFTDKYFINKDQIAAVDILLQEKITVSLSEQSIYNKLLVIGQDKIQAYGFIKACKIQ